MYADDLVLCVESEEDPRAMVGRFTELCRRRGLKVNAGKNKVIVLGAEVASGRKLAGAIKSLINARSLQLECARVLA